VAYGIVGLEQGKEILSRVVAKSKSIGFTQWHLGVPGNLIPCRKEDMIGPSIGLDGEPVRDHFAWPEGRSGCLRASTSSWRPSRVIPSSANGCSPPCTRLPDDREGIIHRLTLSSKRISGDGGSHPQE